MPFKSIAQIKAANEGIGQYWFEPATMDFFNTVIEARGEVFGGCYFITSERMETSDPKRYTVRRANDNGTIDTVGNMGDFASATGAVAFIRAHFAR